ncbi:MAG TPA: branched-chain amino acid ABC transporter permease [Acidimicrobiales bacterium]|nr:branched-chain amino acid ABC transporter permease [Acidimicrobiales bacterium]
MSVFLSLLLAGLALGAVYFLAASGLSLIYGLMDVLNFAHGLFMTLGAYAAWDLASHLPASWGGWLFVVELATATGAGALVALLTEIALIRPLYGRPISQILVTIGLDLAVVGLLLGGFGSNPQSLPTSLWLLEASRLGSVVVPHADVVALIVGLAVLLGLEWFLRRTRYGIIVRAGVENRDMVRALGVDVSRAFTLVFVIGGAMAGLAGLLYAMVFAGDLVSPTQGDSLLIFAFIVVVIGGLGSIRGSAVAAILVGLAQDFTNYYFGSHSGFAEIGNLSVVLILILVLEWRPQGLFGRVR